MFLVLCCVVLCVVVQAAFSYYAFSSPNLLTLSQMTASLILLSIFKRAGWAHYQDFNMVREHGSTHNSTAQHGMYNRGEEADQMDVMHAATVGLLHADVTTIGIVVHD